MTKEKRYGREYTPEYIVNNMLDLSGYSNSCILDKHIIDNSCGNGAILKQVVEQYCSTALLCGLSKQDISYRLSEYIHGIDIDADECDKCKRKLDMTARKYKLNNINWDIRCANALGVTDFNDKMDYVIGNPPYIRIRNLPDTFDKNQFLFAQGMTDLYIVFFEIGLRMLNNNGILCYITPNSYFNSSAGKCMRKYFTDTNILSKTVDFGHYQIFNTATYSAITVLDKSKSNRLTEYYEYDAESQTCRHIRTFADNSYMHPNGFLFRPYLEITPCDGNNGIQVKNGYATLCDKVFIGNHEYDSDHIIPVIKASTGTKSRIIYPYDANGDIISEDELRKDLLLYSYLKQCKNVLEHRSIDSNAPWYSFGRNQAIKDTYTNKLAISPYLKDRAETMNVPSGTGVYGGLYIVSQTIDLKEIENSLNNDDFYRYIRCVGKPKSGGYYIFSSKDVKNYLNSKFTAE